MGAGIVISILWKLRYLIAALAVAGAVWWAYEWFTGVIEERDRLRGEVGRVIAANKANAKAMRELSVEHQIERELTARELKQAQERLAASRKLVEEMRNVPGFNDPAGAVWDEYARRLRAGSGDRTPNH